MVRLHSSRVTSPYGFLWIVGSLALLLFPFVQLLHSGAPPNALSGTMEAIFSLLLSMGFSSPVFFYFAHSRKSYLGALQSEKNGSPTLLPAHEAQVEAEMRHYLAIGWVGIGLGALAIAIGTLYFLK